MEFTKLMRILLFITVFMSIWLAFVTESVPIELSAAAKEVLFASPIYLLITFACYSLGVVGYRVATFNDCEEAAHELKQQIVDAKKDLKSKGFKSS